MIHTLSHSIRGFRETVSLTHAGETLNITFRRESLTVGSAVHVEVGKAPAFQIIAPTAGSTLGHWSIAHAGDLLEMQVSYPMLTIDPNRLNISIRATRDWRIVWEYHTRKSRRPRVAAAR